MKLFSGVRSEQWVAPRLVIRVLCDPHTKGNLIAHKSLCKLVVDPKDAE